MDCTCAEIPLDPQFRFPSDLHRAVRNLLTAVSTGILIDETGNFQLDKLAHPLEPGATWPSDILQRTLRCRRCGRRFDLCADTYHGGGSLEATRES
jgi:hypothetical protein